MRRKWRRNGHVGDRKCDGKTALREITGTSERRMEKKSNRQKELETLKEKKRK